MRQRLDQIREDYAGLTHQDIQTDNWPRRSMRACCRCPGAHGDIKDVAKRSCQSQYIVFDHGPSRGSTFMFSVCAMSPGGFPSLGSVSDSVSTTRTAPAVLELILTERITLFCAGGTWR